MLICVDEMRTDMLEVDGRAQIHIREGETRRYKASHKNRHKDRHKDKLMSVLMSVLV